VSRVEKNSDSSTGLDGEARGFPTTQGSWIDDLGREGSYRRAIDLVCQRYWKPIYWYIRFSAPWKNEECKDLTQSFLVWLLEDKALRDYAPAKGRFRPFLKLILRRFLGHEAETSRRLKRGGGVRVLALDDPSFPGASVPDTRTDDPEKAFDRLWAMELARHAIDRVRARLREQGREIKFDIYSAIDLCRSETVPSYQDLASRTGLGEHDVRNYLRDVRAMIREEIRGDLAETVERPEDLEAEWHELFGL
jgi:DNA-directed RNA polymerase specialized sigma24 family protein